MTQAERITALEVKVDALTDKVEKLTETNKDLVASLNQGRGGLAVLSFIIGSSLVAAIAAVTGMFK